MSRSFVCGFTLCDLLIFDQLLRRKIDDTNDLISKLSLAEDRKAISDILNEYVHLHEKVRGYIG